MPLPTHFTLNTGAQIPAVGFGTWQAAPNEVERAVETALKAGYRHIDCAAIYRNEVEVGEGIRKSGVPRSEIFITGKLWNTKHAPEDVEAALDKTLHDLGTEYLDLFLMHWPVAFKSSPKWFPLQSDGLFDLAPIDPATTYIVMEKLLSTGKVRAIGVSNFTINQLKSLMSKTKVVPATNQIEAHPYLQQPALFDFCKEKGILIEAYSPLGNNQTGEPRTVDDPLVGVVGQRLGMDGGQLLASWGVQRGTVVLPKSVTPHRIKSNLQVKALSKDAFDDLNSLERHKRFNQQSRWGFDIFEELGEKKVKEIAESLKEENLVKFTV
ncbi:NADP-dependent oxidoreductase domain-containing protein [Dendryphion nanum]|uniref:NADP-dependent oxidoreductase domain-containing protein n=1 Tax=Dendryphion nanum TaxID=256645 RepID=A0A9P9EDB1_9PLEO|nr:NADP-dependent oxidoreductase domain-containing protein [Dendryphion nanum]